MKRFCLQSSSLLLTAALTAFTFAACDDGDGENTNINEMAGSYELTTVEKDNGAGTMNPQCLTIDPTYTEEDITALNNNVKVSVPAMGALFGSDQVGLADLVGTLDTLLPLFVEGALVSLDLKEDGSFSAKYHNFVSSGDLLTDFISPNFDTAVSTFPGGTDDLIPADMLSYYTDANAKLIYFCISKSSLDALDPSLTEMIDNMLDENPGLPIVSNQTVYALPLRYAITTDYVKVYLDRATLAPIAPLVPVLLAVAEVDLSSFVDLEDLLDKLFDNTSALDICIYLKRV